MKIIFIIHSAIKVFAINRYYKMFFEKKNPVIFFLMLVMRKFHYLHISIANILQTNYYGVKHEW